MEQRVLLIEDEREWYDRVRLMLAAFPCPDTGRPVSLAWADTLADGEAQIDAGGWSLIICDLYLATEHEKWTDPGAVEVGLELVKRADERRAATGEPYTILVLTQFSKDQALYTRAIELGANEVVGKRDRHEIRIAIEEALKRESAEPGDPAAPGDESQPDTDTPNHVAEFRVWQSLCRLWPREARPCES